MVGEFTGPVGTAVSVFVIITSQFVEPEFKVEKLEEHIRLADQEKHELYWRFFLGVGIPDNIERDIEAQKIYDQYISKIIGQDDHYDRVIISLPSILFTKSRSTSCMTGTPHYTKVVIDDIKLNHESLVNVEPHTEYTSNDISRVIPGTVKNYKAVCGPLDKDIKEIVVKKKQPEGAGSSCPLSRETEVKKWFLQEYQENVTSCKGTVVYKKGVSSPLKSLLYLPNSSAHLYADPRDNLDIYFKGESISSRVPTSVPRNTEYGGVHRYYFPNQLVYCSISNPANHFFYITGKERFHCDIVRTHIEQKNTIVTQGNCTDFRNIYSIMGNDQTNYIEAFHANYVDGKGGSDVITATNNSTIIKGYVGDSIHGNGLVLLSMNLSDIDKITYANNIMNIYNEGGEFISIDGQKSFKTADGLLVAPILIRVDDKTNTVTNLHVIKRVDSNIMLDDGLNNLQTIDNSNFNIIKQLLSINYDITIDDSGYYIFYPDKEHHNFYWETSSDISHLYLIDQRNANITIAKANGILNFSQLNSTLNDMPFIKNDEGEIKIKKDDLNVVLLPDYKNVTVTFDEKEYYKLQDGKLERDYCSHNLKIDGRFSVNGTDLLNHHNCFTFDSDKVLFLKRNNDLLLLSDKGSLSISDYYSYVHKNWGLSVGLNNRIMEPEEFGKRADSPSAFRYYRPDERGLKVYHNQPINKHQIGLMDLKNSSISGWDMRIIGEHLILSLRNMLFVEVEGWNIKQPAREMMFFFNDTVVFNAKCVFSNCNPEDIIKEFEEEKARFYSIIDTPLLSALRKGDLGAVDKK